MVSTDHLKGEDYIIIFIIKRQVLDKIMENEALCLPLKIYLLHL